MYIAIVPRGKDQEGRSGENRRVFQLLVVAAYICAVCSGDLGRLVVAEKGENDALD